MRTTGLSRRQLTNMAIIGIIAFSSNACQGPQGPTWKEQVSQALEHYYKGEDSHRKGDLETAEKEYLASIDISPRPFAYYRLAQIQERQGHVNEALADLDQALKLSPGYQRALLFKKQLQVRLQGNSSTAVSLPAEETSKSISPEPMQEQADIIKETTSEILQTSSDVPVSTVPSESSQADISPEKAITPESSSQKQPSPTVPDQNLQSDLTQKAQQAVETKDWANAQKYYEMILKDQAQDDSAWYSYGFVCFQQKLWDQAETAFRHVVTLNPKSADAYNDLGVTLEKNNKSGEAVQAYQMAVDIGTNPDAFFNLALLKEKLGDYKTSVTLYEKYLELDSKSSYAEYVRQRIEKLRRLAF